MTVAMGERTDGSDKKPKGMETVMMVTRVPSGDLTAQGDVNPRQGH